MHRWSFSALLLLSAALTSSASAAGRFEGSVGFLVGTPQGEFEDQVDQTGFGIDLDGGFRPAESPLVIGGRFGFMSYGSDSRREPFNPNIPEVTIEVETSNNLLFGQAFLRLEPKHGVVRPFIEGLVGFNYLFTESSVKDERNGEVLAGSTNFDDTTICYGGGGGLKFRVWRNTDRPKGPISVNVLLRADYVKGGEARYLKEGSISVQNGRVVYDALQSETDLLTYTIGASVDIGH